MNTLSAVERVVIPSTIAARSQEVLRTAGRAGLEGMVLWAGPHAAPEFQVTELIVPQQRGLKTSDGVCVIVDGDELHRLNVHLHESSLRLIAQIHSHPGRAYHSDTDDRYAVATTVGCFSLVVPDFAKRAFNLAECAVYRLSNSGEWLEVDDTIAPNQLVVGRE